MWPWGSSSGSSSLQETQIIEQKKNRITMLTENLADGWNGIIAKRYIKCNMTLGFWQHTKN